MRHDLSSNTDNIQNAALVNAILHLLFHFRHNSTSSLALKPYSRLSLNEHLYKTHTCVKRTPRVGSCLSLLPLFDSL